MNQLNIHKRIDDFLKADINIASVEVAKELIQSNFDAKNYFFAKANEKWLRWIFDNGLFYELKKKAEEVAKFTYRLPELDYLTKMAEVEPKLVTDIILATPISKESFNPEVIDRFLWITGLLPSKQLKEILPVMLSQNWVQLMKDFHRSGYEFHNIVNKLKEAKDYESLIVLSKIIFTVRDKKELAKEDILFRADKLFYLHDISDTGIFEVIIDSDNDKKKESLKVFVDILTQVIGLGKNEEEVFEKEEPFYLLDVDIFELGLDMDRTSYTREDIQNIVATCKSLIETLFGTIDEKNSAEIRSIYDAVNLLPDSRTSFKLKLFTVTRSPKLFKEELRDMLFRVFNVGERYFEIDGGAEYHRALMAGFNALDVTVQQEYINKVKEYYGETLEDKDKQKWRRSAGLKVLIYVSDYIKEVDKPELENLFGKISKDVIVTPNTLVGKMHSGFVSHKSPVKLSDYQVKDIVEHLKTEWSPVTLNKKFKNDDFLNPRGAEGLGDEIKVDMKERLDDYLFNINSFFNKIDIDPSYVYSVLSVIDEMLRNKKILSEQQYKIVINFFKLICDEGRREPFKRKDDKSWLPDWITVHKIMADILLNTLPNIRTLSVFKDNRNEILAQISYLLTIKESPNTEDEKPDSGEPFHTAINSVRGRAYEAFIQFIYNDDEKLIKDDVKKVFEYVLENDKSNAVRFVVGYYLPSLYFRDIKYIKGLLNKIFPKDEPKNRKVYFATWEGYLANSLYKELFVELGDYYDYAVKIDPADYPDRKYSKGLDETLAVHIALAYSYLDLKVGDLLFNLFWKVNNEKRHHEFISFIGRSCITKDVISDKWFIENKVDKNKLVKFWDWVLVTDLDFSSKIYSGFGFWVNPDKEIIPDNELIKRLVVTLVKSNGEIDWDYALMRRLVRFAEVDPNNTLKIIRNYLLSSKGGLNPHRRVPMFSIDNEIKKALDVIFNNKENRKDVVNLIDELITQGSRIFWGLKDVIK